MIRGTTAYFKFKMPYAYNQVASVTITFWQNHNDGPSESRPLPIIKTLSHCSQTGEKELSVSLNSEETARFVDIRKAYVQMIAEHIEGHKFGCKQQEITVYPVEDGEPDIPVVPPDDDDDGIVILDGGLIE